jgi:hypothetical protein
MGQVALGLKNLAIKLAIFVVMAALLAWALGGTLWPRAEIVDRPSVQFQGVECFWRLTVGGKEPGVMRWTLMTRPDQETKPTAIDDARWVEVAGPIIIGETLYFAGRESFEPDAVWRIGEIRSLDAAPAYTTVDDRLLVEHEFRRRFDAVGVDGDRSDEPVVVDPEGDLADDADVVE